MSPIFDHVLIGGGQDAAAVTTTAAKAGYFEARFFHKVFAEEFANARGHFSPINSGAHAGHACGLCVALRWQAARQPNVPACILATITSSAASSAPSDMCPQPPL